MFGLFWRNERGATSIEYALIATLISLAIIGGVTQFTDSLNILWGNNGGRITEALK